MTLLCEVADVLEGRARWAVVHADCREVLGALPRRSVHHAISDPPFSALVHAQQRRMLRGAGGREARDGARRGEVGYAPLGFDALTPDLQRRCAVEWGRVAQRWIIAKTDHEGSHAWRSEVERVGLRWVRAGIWRKLGAQPQLSGDRPAVAHEILAIAHQRRERLRWNSGGDHAWWEVPDYWDVPIATDRHATGERVHTTQTPVDLWLKVVRAFTDHGELVLDCFAGSGSLGVACLRLGRRYVGVEVDPRYAALARQALEAESRGMSRVSYAAGQLPLLEGL